ncbi:MAG: C4-type zinc ribbon domain-containing protein [Actinomycetota bacterium]|nr:C4-type zinc ribbon domain-containing protein [Actinomycetota bacterium]
MTAHGFVELLPLQELDVRLDQLRHRRTKHPLAAELRKIESEQAAQQAIIDEIVGRRTVFDTQQGKIEEDIEHIDYRRADIEKRLYDGSVTGTKDLLAMQTESAHLAERKSALEDHELEVMEALEPIVAEFETASAVSDAILVRRADKQLELERALGDVQDELTELEPRRAQLAAGLPAELVERYEALRVEFGGVALVQLVGSSCSGCHLALSAMDVDRIRHQGAAVEVRCPECNRVFVH